MISAAILLLALTAISAQAQAQAQAQKTADTAGVTGPIPLTPRIIGGQAAAPGTFPSVMPMLQTIPGLSPFQRQGCGATLIAPNWVITAAHCVVEGGATLPSSFWSVLPGVTNLSVDDNADRSGEVEVLTIYAHPEFDPRTFQNDIALLELAQTIDLPIVSLFSGDSSSLVGVGALLVGWGVSDISDPDNPLFPTDQQFVEAPIVSNAVCNAPESYDGTIADSQICAGLAEGGIDSCQGDSGGPMIIGIDGVQVQAGIVSFGTGCALPNFYGVYTNVSSFRAWISNFVAASYLPADTLVDDPGVTDPQSPVAVPSETDPSGQLQGLGEQPFVQANPAGPNPFTPDSGGSSGGGAALWWLMLGAASVTGRSLFRRRSLR